MIDERILENLLEQKAAKYYAKSFASIEKKGWLVPTWNWGCFFFSGFWMLYRKLGLAWFLYITVLGLAGRFFLAEFGITGFYVFYAVFAKFLIPMYANAYMYRRVRKYIRRLQINGDNPMSAEYRHVLASITSASKDNPRIL